MGHSVRACVIGMRIADEIGLPPQVQADLYYTLLLKDAGSTDANLRMANLFRRHPAWGAVIQSNGRGQYRLRTE